MKGSHEGEKVTSILCRVECVGWGKLSHQLAGGSKGLTLISLTSAERSQQFLSDRNNKNTMSKQ